jgi:hypothetical protein
MFHEVVGDFLHFDCHPWIEMDILRRFGVCMQSYSGHSYMDLCVVTRMFVPASTRYETVGLLQIEPAVARRGTCWAAIYPCCGML